MSELFVAALTRSIEKLSLHSAIKTVPRELVNQQRMGLLIEPRTRERLKAAWEPRHARFKQIAHPWRTIALQEDVRDIENVDRAAVDLALERIRKDPPYDRLKLELKQVRVRKLVTPQLTVSPTRGADLVPASSMSTPAEMFDAAFRPRREPLSIEYTREIKGQWSAEEHFDASDLDIRIHLPPQLRKLPLSPTDSQSDLADALCFFVGRGLPYVAVHAISAGSGQARFIATNGIHRLYRWALQGQEFVPAILAQGPLGGPDAKVADLTWGILGAPGAQLPMLTDFLNFEVTLRLVYAGAVNKTTLKWEYESHQAAAAQLGDLDVTNQ